ncbi:MAG: tRNA pseudouridine(38-40) synthase TruA [Deltaproteobacteria bacterium]|nr:tRNA pseudouridine(38-40) synthase TruA [Deltaproteobacteria bacterium]
MHLGFRVAYDGKDFFGFQSQKNQHTLQDEIEKSLSIYFGKKIRIDFTSRTDAGVHAFDQWIMIKDGMKLYKKLSLYKQKSLLYSLNSLLAPSVNIVSVLQLSKDFHPKRSVKSKEYSYFVFQGPVLDPFMRQRSWWIRSALDFSKMKKAMKEIVGKHDFSAFAKMTSLRNKKDGIRKILKADLFRTPHPFIQGVFIFEFRFLGEGFLHHMVRNLVGTVVEIGQRRSTSKTALSISQIRESKDRRVAGKTAPAAALFLNRTVVPAKFWRCLEVSEKLPR